MERVRIDWVMGIVRKELRLAGNIVGENEGAGLSPCRHTLVKFKFAGRASQYACLAMLTAGIRSPKHYRPYGLPAR